MKLSRIWMWVRWPLAALLVGFIALVIWRYQVLVEQDKTDVAVAAIHANRLTEEDVFGDLPPEPNKTENDATLAGIDTNANGIRDDVERAIYFKYQASAKDAAPAFQYAKALQMEFTHVYNSPTLVAVIQEQARGSLCLEDDEKISQIEELVFNNDQRSQHRENNSRMYMTSYTLPSPNGACDISL